MRGKVASAMNAGSKPCVCAASVSVCPVSVWLFESQLAKSRVCCGLVDAVVICASRVSG
jgi:hypothetical protein